MTATTERADRVQIGDRIIADGEVLLVRHVMTSGKKAQTTSIDVYGPHDPLLYAPDAPVQLAPLTRPCIMGCGLAAEPGDVYCEGDRSAVR